MNLGEATFQLEKSLWTVADYSEMGWHDATVHALAFVPGAEPGARDLAFDIDYIFRWVDPAAPHRPYTFWIAPCSLVFEDVAALEMTIEQDSVDALEIADLELLAETAMSTGVQRHAWRLRLQTGELRFQSAGFQQFVRGPPIHTSQQSLAGARGDPSFARSRWPHPAAR